MKERGDGWDWRQLAHHGVNTTHKGSLEQWIGLGCFNILIVGRLLLLFFFSFAGAFTGRPVVVMNELTCHSQIAYDPAQLALRC